MGGYKGLKRCSVCDYSNKLTSQVRRHEIQAHGPNAVPCTFPGCSMRLPYNRLARHMREKHSMPPNSSPSIEDKVELGNIDVPRFDDVQLMDATTALLEQFSCTECGKMFKERGRLRKHLNAVHGAKQRSGDNSSMDKGTKKKKVHQCDWPGCGLAFTAPAKLADHRNSHTGDRPYDCEHCKRDFGNKAEFGRHLRKYHSISLRSLNNEIEQNLIDLNGI